jgi:hypothetical protein
LKDFISTKGKVKSGTYVLHHQNGENQDILVRGTPRKSIGGGVSVKFDAMDALTTNPTMPPLSSRKRRGMDRPFYVYFPAISQWLDEI